MRYLLTHINQSSVNERHVWRNMSDSFDILENLEIFGYDVFTETSSLVIVVTSDVTHSTHDFGDL